MRWRQVKSGCLEEERLFIDVAGGAGHMAVVKVDHINIACANLEETANFYTEVLGFNRGQVKQSGAKKMLNLVKQDSVVELAQPTDGEGLDGDAYNHIAFTSDDIQADFEHMKALGFTLLNDSVQESAGAFYFFMEAPGGALVEIITHK